MEKKACELFAGVGGFRLGLERLHSGWDTVWFSQWEPGKKVQWAHDCYVEHFGDCKDINGEYRTGEDVSTIDKSKIPDHTLLAGGFPCLTGDSLVMTKRGYIFIKDVKAGDEVLSHDRKWHPVADVYQRGKKDIYKLTAYGLDELRLTGNHRLFVRRRTSKMSDPEWMDIDSMKDADIRHLYLGIAINGDENNPTWNGVEYHRNKTLVKIKKELDMNDERLWYLAGRYLGGGWLRKQQKHGMLRNKYNGIIICSGRKKTEALKKFLDGFLSYTFVKGRTADKFIISSVELAAFMEQFGSGAEQKHVPGFCFNMPERCVKALLKGYLDADGYINKKYKYLRYGSVSRTLIYGIAYLYEKVYHVPAYVYAVEGRGGTRIEGREVNEKKCFYARFRTEPLEHVTAFYEDGYVWYPITNIQKCREKEPVYDIAVEESHSFVVNGCISHNCQDYSVARTLSSSKGIEGKKGVLWWQVRDTIIAKKPPFCLLENVDRLLKSPAKQRGRDFGIILACLNEQGYSVEWRVVNAAQYGGAQRRRRTFIFAYRNDTEYGKKMSRLDAGSVLLHEGFMVKAFPIENAGMISFTSISTDIKKVSDEFQYPFENAGFMRNGLVYTCTVEEQIEKPVLLGDILEPEAPEKYFIPEEQMQKWTYLKGAKKIPRRSASGHEYVFSEGPVAFPDSYDRPGRTMLTSESTLNRSTHVVTDRKTGKLRTLTPVEAERLQGFDDNWTLHTAGGDMPDRMRFFCMGNALVVPMITRMGKVLDEIIESEP